MATPDCHSATDAGNHAADVSTMLAELERERLKFTRALVAPNTRTGYHYDQAAFRRWAEQMGRASLPASPETVALYVTSMLMRGLKVTTARRRLSAVTHLHRAAGYGSPTDARVWELLRGAKRLRVEQVERVLPLAVEELRAIALELLADDTPISIRNWAMLLTGFAAALRNSSTAALLLSDVEFSEKGATLTIRRSKTDQEGVGHLIGLPHGKHPETCPVSALKKWIDRRGLFPGPLFIRFDGHPPRDRALVPERVGQVVQECIERIGKDSRLYGGHSLRAGFVTEAGECGAGELLIASQTGHRDMSTLRQYFRRRDVFARNAVRMMDL